jgi:hypothetical protein
VSGTLLGFTLKRALNLVNGTVQRLYAHFKDQTEVFLTFERAEACPNSIPMIANEGLIKFAIGTHSSQEIYIKKIEIEFPAELQLSDPDGGSFFESNLIARNDALPFQLTWHGNHPIGPLRRVIFAVKGRFSENIVERKIRFTIYAQKQTIGCTRFQYIGPIQVYSEEKNVTSTSSPIRGLEIPPLHGCSLIQPFLVNSGLTVSAQAPIVGPVVVHQQLIDGTSSTHQFFIKGKKSSS